MEWIEWVRLIGIDGLILRFELEKDLNSRPCSSKNDFKTNVVASPLPIDIKAVQYEKLSGKEICPLLFVKHR